MVALSGAARADTPRRHWVSGSFELGSARGGDSLLVVGWSDGSRTDLDAGAGFSLDVGVMVTAVESLPHSLDLDARVGKQVARIGGYAAYDGRAVFSRYPIELVASYRYTWLRPSYPIHVRVGVGPTLHASPVVDGDRSLALYGELDTGVGGVAQVEWMAGGLSVAVRYTRLSYPIPGSADAIDGSGLGLLVRLYFGGGLWSQQRWAPPR